MSGKSSVRISVIILGLILIPINTWWLIQMEEFRYAGHPTTASLFFNVIFILLVLMLINTVIRRFFPKAALKQTEFLTLYVMLSVSSAISGHDQIIGIPPAVGYPYWFATPENEWETIFFNKIPEWLSISQKKVLQNYYEGDSSLYFRENLIPWIRPLAWWGAFYFVVIFIILCLNSVIRKQWIEHEKLSYPIIQLPLAMTSGKTFWSNKVLWLGFAVAASIDIINGLHYIFPVIPSLPVKQRNIGHLFTSKPFNAIGWFPISFYPFAIGLCFFAPLDLLFSGWFFYLFSKIQRIIVATMGWRSVPGLPFYDEQVFGAAVVIFAFALWGSREHIKKVLKETTKGKRKPDEPISYRNAVLGIVVGMVLLFLFCRRAGMNPWLILPYFAIYFILWMTITRIRAQLGPPVHDFWSYTAGASFGHPDMMLVPLLGTRRIGHNSLTMISFFWSFNKGFRGHPAPHQLEGFKLAEQANINSRRLFGAIILSSIVGIIFCFWTLLHFSYKTGAPGVSYYAGVYFERYLTHWLYYPEGTNYSQVMAMGAGAIFAGFLMMMRWRFVAWPFHPVGYALSGSWTMNLVWFVFLISWALKAVILKQGGYRSYKKATPFFLGLILGEFTVGTLWTIIGVITKKPNYAFWY
ncbi:hypothetical protein GF312_17785 [Candidatus Poribacteria bacterium]|nr:hypothetical protein [Candidatus Poribacteria bacterium]